MKATTVLLAAILTIVTSSAARADGTPTADVPGDIIKRMKTALEPARPSVRRIDIVLRDAEGVETAWTAREARKRIATGNRVAMVMLSPSDLAGSAFIIQETEGGPDVQWVYLPTVRRVRKIFPVGGFEPVFGTDFTYADLGFVDLQDRSLALIGTEPLPNGGKAYKVQETPRNQWYCSRIVDWVDVDRLLPIKRMYYSPAGDLWKTLYFDNVTVIQGVPTPLVIRMENAFERSSTELRIDKVRYDREIPDDVFDPQRLPFLLDHPIWKSEP